MKRAYLGLGSNMGGKIDNLRDAVNMIGGFDGIDVVSVSSVYETAPVGYTDQGNFANICIEVVTSMSPLELLNACNHVENELGRVRMVRWGPRTLDVDVLLYEGYISDDEKLTVPHPRMWERAFVLIPLDEISGNMTPEERTMLNESMLKIDEEQKKSVKSMGIKIRS